MSIFMTKWPFFQPIMYYTMIKIWVILNGKRDFILVSYLLLDFELYCFSGVTIKVLQISVLTVWLCSFFNGHIIFIRHSMYCWAENSHRVQAWMWSSASCLEKHRMEVCVLVRSNSHTALKDDIFMLKTVNLALCILLSNSR